MYDLVCLLQLTKFEVFYDDAPEATTIDTTEETEQTTELYETTTAPEYYDDYGNSTDYSIEDGTEYNSTETDSDSNEEEEGKVTRDTVCLYYTNACTSTIVSTESLSLVR